MGGGMMEIKSQVVGVVTQIFYKMCLESKIKSQGGGDGRSPPPQLFKWNCPYKNLGIIIMYVELWLLKENLLFILHIHTTHAA